MMHVLQRSLESYGVALHVRSSAAASTTPAHQVTCKGRERHDESYEGA